MTDAELDDLPDDPTDRLHIQSHAWAAATSASPNPVRSLPRKLQSIMNRGAAKEATDLLDILSITLDRDCGPLSRDQLESADSQLRADALLHARRWFDQTADRSLIKIRAVPEGREVTVDDVRLVGEPLVAALAS